MTGRHVPADARMRAALPDATFAYAFTVETSRVATPEQWARAVIEGAPRLWRVLLLIGWRYVFGLRLGPRDSPGTVLGLAIESSDDQSVVLAAESPVMVAKDVFLTGPGTVTWVTLVRYRSLLGRLAWSAAVPVHVVTVPYLLRRARP